MMAESVSVRKPPVEAVFALHLPREPGKCPWCGLEITERTPVRKQLKTIHSTCSAELGIITSPEQARWYVFKRDKGICADCGEDFSEMYRYKPTWKEGHMWHIQYRDDRGNSCHPEEGYPYVSITAISMWHVDHHNSLESAARLPPLQRIEFFKLANLKTRCDRCHNRKSAKEASRRAHYRELAGENVEKPKRDWPKRGLQSRAEFTPRPPRQIDKGE